MRHASANARPFRSRAQNGVVLFITLIVLVAMTLAGIAMMRQVGTGVQIAGNLAFKQVATSVADRGIEAGRAWLIAQGAATLVNDATATGYYSSWQPGFDPRTHDWSGNAALLTADDGFGNEIRYVVHRLCAVAGQTVNAPTQQCVTLGAAGAGASKGGGSYGVLPLTTRCNPISGSRCGWRDRETP
jgi:Tfp pilus assembly protein PilX